MTDPIELERFRIALEQHGYVEEVMDDVVTGVTFNKWAPIVIRWCAAMKGEKIFRGIVKDVAHEARIWISDHGPCQVEVFIAGWFVTDNRDVATILGVVRDEGPGVKSAGIVSIDNWRGPYRVAHVR